MFLKLFIRPCLIGLYLVISLNHAKGHLTQANVPPRITSSSPSELSYKVGEQAILQCEATGRPTPSFEWKKDGSNVLVDGYRVKFRPNSGSIIIDEPKNADEGTYQCFARNGWGAAVSSKILFKKAVLEPFPSIKLPKVHKLPVGSKFTLECKPPKSYPPGLIYWGENKPGARLKPIDNIPRISSDYEGNLHFSNIMPEDYRNGFSYICIVQNTALRSLVQGDDQVIQPENKTESLRVQPLELMWSSATKMVAIRGQVLRMKCIFSGYPTPTVSWQRIDSVMSTSAEFPSFGQEISIKNVQFDDEGSYQCDATRSDSETIVSKNFEVVVESIPYWRQDRAPEDVNVSEDESAQVYCHADGKPKPSISWSINGIPIEELPSDTRRTISENSVSYSKVTKADVQVLQCNASNTHGYILANAFINVLAEPPSFTRTPQTVVKVAEGENVTLTCRVFGAPKPKIIWKYSASGPTEDIVQKERISLQSTGDLWIKSVIRNDSGRYICQASNKFGTDEVSGELIVRERTIITVLPNDQIVNASSVVVFPCNAKTDPLESSALVIEWRRNGEKIDFLLHPHMEHRKLDNSLILTGVEASDSANYTCHASNGVDFTEATARLIVRDCPDPPVNVWLENRCLENKAEIKWTPGNDNNDRIMEYIIYSNTSHDPPNRFRNTISIPGSAPQKSALLNLLPWTTYSFHITARNSLGESQRSRFTSDSTNCTTPPTSPFRHPDGVCTISRQEDQLVIVWRPMDPAEHNGENFHYVVGYKKRNEQDPRLVEMDWRANELVIPNQPIFTKYEIFVKAVNNKGHAPISDLKRKIGYSGQGTPANVPENFTVQSFNSSSATFTWQKVSESPDEVKGFFLGYRIKVWKTSDPGTFRTEDLILRNIDPCPTLETLERKRRDVKKADDTITGQTNKLWAFSEILAVVMVLNGAHRTGPVSKSIQFTTPEGVPDAVSKFEILERGSNHFVVTWNPPKEPNGILTGYVIEFEEAPSGVIQKKTVVDPSKHSKKITGLKNDTNYVVHIRAQTSVGNGPDMQLQEKTNPSSVPSKPGISGLQAGDDFVVVSWQPSTENDDTKNPGSNYRVEYRPEGSKDWVGKDAGTEDSQINVTGLEKGVKYEVRVIALNDDERQSASDIKIATTGYKTEPVITRTAGSYLYVLVIACVLLLVVFILCVLCYANYNRGADYSVNEREKKYGCAIGKDDEPEFGEYVRPQEKFLLKSSGSVDSLNSKKPQDAVDSDNDSLGEYADPDPSKFNEDGSFIGQYGKKTTCKKDTPPVAFSTYI